MLTSQALNASLPLATVLDQNNLMVIPAQGSPLEAIVNATRSGSTFTMGQPGDVTVDIHSIEYIANTKDETLGYSPHDIAMDDVTEQVAKAVQGHMFFARNTVAPVIADLVEQTTLAMKELTPSKLLGMEIVVDEPPLPMLNSTFEDLVRPMEETPYDDPRLAMRLPTISVQEIKELMKTGTRSLDDQIELWAAQHGDSLFIEIWESLFQLKYAELNENTPKTFRTYVNNSEKGLDTAVAVFLICRKIFDNPPAGTEMNLNAFNATAVEFRNQAAATICHAIDDMKRWVKNKELVRSVQGPVTHVYGPLYREWLETGGDNEVLFGNSLESIPKVTVDFLQADAPRLKSLWQRHSILTATVENNRRYNRVKELLLHGFIKQIAVLSDEEKANVEQQAVLNKFRELLAEVKESELNNLWDLCLKLVCRSRFYYSSAEEILTGVEEVKKQNPSIEVREAAAIAMIKYIAKWVATQFVVKPT